MENAFWANITDFLMPLYYETFPSVERIPVEIELTDDLNQAHARIRPDRKRELLTENKQNDFNGRTVVPVSVKDNIHVLLNTNRIEQYTKDGSMTWIGTLAHEYTHAIDFFQMARMEGLDSYSPLEMKEHYLMFHQWTEYHARKHGYRFLRKYFEVTGQLPSTEEQVQHILNKEAPAQTEIFAQQYNSCTADEQFYLVMQYLGRFSVWIDLFPEAFDETKLLEFCHGAEWMVDLLAFLRGHETLKMIHGHFSELESLLMN